MKTTERMDIPKSRKVMTKTKQRFYNKNQFIITDDKSKTTVFQSYSSMIASIDKEGKLTLFENWDYSSTTRKHLYLFLRDYHYKTYREIANARNKRETIQKLIDNNIILFTSSDSLDAQ